MGLLVINTPKLIRIKDLYLHIDTFVVRVNRQPGDVGFVVEVSIHVTTPLHRRSLRVPTGTLS